MDVKQEFIVGLSFLCTGIGLLLMGACGIWLISTVSIPLFCGLAWKRVCPWAARRLDHEFFVLQR